MVQTEISEKPVIPEKGLPDFYGELGCCLTCTEDDKNKVQGLQRNVYYGGKFYDCLCFTCKCVPCEWYVDGYCARKNHDDY